MDALLTTVVVNCVLFCGRPGPPKDHTPPVITCPSDRMQINDPVQTHARVVWDPPEYAVDDQDGIIRKLDNLYGQPGWSYNDGITKIGYGARDSTGNWGTCHFEIIVNVIRCAPPPLPAHGYYICHPSDSPRYGTRCIYGCHHGYLLQGNDTTLCTDQGTWSSSRPQCQKIKCPELRPIQYGSLACTDGNRYLSRCTYSCDAGYDIAHGMKRLRTCAGDERWSGDTPTCIDFEPPTIDNCPDSILVYTASNRHSAIVWWTPPTARDNSWGSVSKPATLVAGMPPGSDFPIGTADIVYTAEDVRNRQVHPCRFKVHVRRLTCPTLHSSTDLRVQCPDGYGFGAVCRFKCLGSSTLVGDNVVSCMRQSNHSADWAWGATGHPPTCQASQCPDLAPGNHSAVTCDFWLYGRYCRTSCQSGYDFPNKQTRQKSLYVCKDSGLWDLPGSDLTLPHCAALSPPGHVIMPTASYFNSRNCCSDESRQLIVTEVTEWWENTSAYQGTCLGEPSNPCHVRNVKVTCSSCQSLTPNLFDHVASIQLEIVATPRSNLSSYDSYTSAKRKLFSAYESLLYLNHTGGDLGSDLIYKHSEFGLIYISCDEGRSPASHGCVGCAVGEHLGDRGECTPCPQHTYQDEEGRVGCKLCPDGMGTELNGSTTPTQCRDMCPPGMASDSGVAPCNPCAVGSYSSRRGSTACQTCPTATTTPIEGATSYNACSHYDISFTEAAGSQAAISKPFSVSAHSITVSLHVSIHGELTAPTLVLRGTLISQTDTGTQYDLLTITADQDGVLTVSVHQCEVRLPVSQVNVITGKWYGLVITWHQDNLQMATLTVYNSGESIMQRSCNIPTPVYPDDPWIRVLIGSPQFVGSVSAMNVWDNVLDESSISQASMCGDAVSGTVIAWDDVPTQAVLNTVSLEIPSRCDDTDDCLRGDCLHDAQCVDLLGEYECLCRPGYTGRNCKTNVDDCPAHECENNATCADGVNSYSCQCRPGYKGDFCEVEIINGGWSEWGEWRICSKSCDTGSQPRERLCNNPLPDPDGRPCVGLDAQTQACNEDACPFCSELTSPAHGDMVCANVPDGGKNCTLQCESGYDFAEEPLDQYWCGPSTNYSWSFQTDDNPYAQLPDCTEITAPQILKIIHSLKYPSMPCTTDVVQSLTRLLKTKASDVPCVKNNLCEIEIKSGKDCQDTGSDDGVVAEVVISVTDDVGDDFNVTQDDDGLRLLDQRVDHLREAAVFLNTSTTKGQFTLYYETAAYPVGGHDLYGRVECPSGMTYVTYYCVPCGAGHYKNDVEQCERCPLGEYQSANAAEQCTRCPAGTTTAGRGSKSVTYCNVPFTGSIPETTTESAAVSNTSEEPAPDDYLTIIVVAATLPVVLVMAVAVLAVLIYKHKVTLDEAAVAMPSQPVTPDRPPPSLWSVSGLVMSTNQKDALVRRPSFSSDISSAGPYETVDEMDTE